MRNTLYIICACVSLLLFAACENKRDDNGDLGGMWQMTEWRDAQDSLLHSNPGIYYCIHMNLLQFRPIDTSFVPTAHIRHTPDSLILLDVYDTARKDSVAVTFAQLSHFAIPLSGGFRISHLDADHLTLRSESATLHFRKY